MEYLKDFLTQKDVTKSKVFKYLKCSQKEAKLLQRLTEAFVEGEEDGNVFDLLDELFGKDNLSHIEHLEAVENLLELGWIVPSGLGLHQESSSRLELLHSDITLSSAFLRLLEEGSYEEEVPQVVPFKDEQEYLQEQFAKVELAWQLVGARERAKQETPTIARMQKRFSTLQKSIQKRLALSDFTPKLLQFFKRYHLDSKEELLFLALLKEEYSNSQENNRREMNALIELVSANEYERMENRALLDEESNLLKKGLIDYEEILSPFGTVTKSFFIPSKVLTQLHSKKRLKRPTLKHLVKEQDIFELLEPTVSLDDVVLHPKTKKRLQTLLSQMDQKVVKRLKEWGIKTTAASKLIFYGPPGTGKTLTALAMAKSLKRAVLSFDCSKILSMYVGESEKNVRKIFDTYADLSQRVKKKPVLLLNEADQFLGARSTLPASSADKMHNQMQNIFLEQIERFDGVLIATTNLLETIDPAFSRRFNYKIEFQKPNFAQRIELWQKLLPKNIPLAKNFSIEKIARYELTGGQIELIIQNTAMKVAMRDEPIFSLEDFVEEIKKERLSAFGDIKSMGFLG